MHILLIEDEQIAGNKLHSYIEKYIDNNAKIHWVRSITELNKALESELSFDLIFSDIELLDGNVFSVYERVKVDSPIIFCTAYDRFIMKAFKVNGIAYLLKPYDEDQFLEAWNKYKTLFDHQTSNITPNILSEIKDIISSSATQFKSRFTIKKSNGVFLLNVSDIVFFQSQGDFILAFDNKGQRHAINYSMNKLKEILDPMSFFQINRGEIIHINYLLKYESHFKNKLAIEMKGTREILYTSGSRTPEFRQWLEA